MTKKILIALNIILGALLVVVWFQVASERQVEHQPTLTVSFIDTSYGRAPEPADLIIPNNEGKEYLQAILDSLFAGDDQLSPEEQCLRIFKYVSSSIRLRVNNGTATSILKAGYSLCYGKSKALTMLFRMAGLPARQLSYMYVSELQSHVLTEVYYDDAWHMYDPTFGIYFYSNPEYDRRGTVSSFHDLIRDVQSGYPILAVPEAGTGLYDLIVRNFSPRAITDAQTELGEEKISIAEYRLAIQNSFPVAFNRNDMVSFPVDVDLTEHTSQWFGELDNNEGDLASYEKRFSGSHYLGRANPPGFHTWVLKIPPFSTFTVEYYGVSLEPPRLSVVPLRAAKIIESSVHNERASFTLQASGNTVIFSVYCPERTFLIDAMHIYR